MQEISFMLFEATWPVDIREEKKIFIFSLEVKTKKLKHDSDK